MTLCGLAPQVLALGLLATLTASAPTAAMTSHAGWPPDQHLVMDKGPAGGHHMLVGRPGRHNYLLGGYGNDTIYGADAGDVIWGDYHPNSKPSFQVAYIHAGNGRNFIYANDTRNYVWTGTGRTVVHAHFGGGVIHCQSSQVIVYLSHHSRPHYRLPGCRHISYFTIGY
jgi:hypothetical protein